MTDMTTTKTTCTKAEACGSCGVKYGIQATGEFICKDGPWNSDFDHDCTHHFCTPCLKTMENMCQMACPICDEDWSDWILGAYGSDTDSDEEDASDSDGE